jgi:hypothetical protein
MKSILSLASLSLVASLGACGVTPSEDLNTSGIHALMSASVTGDGNTYVSASLFNGNPIRLIFVELSEEDRLYASHAGERKQMQETQVLTIVSHNATYEGDAAEEEFEIEFTRGENNDNAPSSVATIPQPFTLDPTPTDPVSRAADLVVSWTGIAPEPMDWRASGTCIQSISGQITEDATVTIAANTLKPSDMNMPSMTCEVTFTITRTRDGDLDRAFGGGAMVGKQERTFTIQSAP